MCEWPEMYSGFFAIIAGKPDSIRNFVINCFFTRLIEYKKMDYEYEETNTQIGEGVTRLQYISIRTNERNESK